MKQRKLELTRIKVESFVTVLESNAAKQVYAGADHEDAVCPTQTGSDKVTCIHTNNPTNYCSFIGDNDLSS